MANNIQQEFEACLGYSYDFNKDQYGAYTDAYVQCMWVGWKMAYNKYHRELYEDTDKEKMYLLIQGLYLDGYCKTSGDRSD